MWASQKIKGDLPLNHILYIVKHKSTFLMWATHANKEQITQKSLKAITNSKTIYIQVLNNTNFIF